MTLVEFVTARLDEDEAMARAAGSAPWTADVPRAVHVDARAIAEQKHARGTASGHVATVEHEANRLHIARHDPARVLREVEAKRQLIQAIYTGMADYAANITESKGDDCGALEYRDELLELLALPYADHPDFRDEWRLPA